jgi:putative spermidine/putrescine transport system permease protein
MGRLRGACDGRAAAMSTARVGEWLLRAYVAVMVVLMVLPIAVVLLTSLTTDAYLSFPPHGISLRWYLDVVTDDQWMSAVTISVRVGAVVVVLAMLIGVPAAIGLHHARGSLATALQTFFLSPLMIPSLVIGLALLRFYETLDVAASAFSVALGQSLIAAPYVVRFVLASLVGVDPGLERAGRILGSGRWRTFRKVTLPLIRHGLIAGALFSFIVSVDDVNIALFLSDVHVTPLSVQLLGYVQQSADPRGAAVASLLVIVAFVLIFICDRIAGIDWLFGIRKA